MSGREAKRFYRPELDSLRFFAFFAVFVHHTLPQDAATVVGAAHVNAPLTECEAAVRLGLKVATLRAWRHQGRGPTFVRLGRAVRYLPSDVEAFLGANRHGAMSDGRL